MKLNKTYPLIDMLNALSKSSENAQAIAKQLKAQGLYEKTFTVFEPENMLSSSPYARVTLTLRESENRWTGYMETSACCNGPRIPVAVNRRDYLLKANADYSHFELLTCAEQGGENNA